MVSCHARVLVSGKVEEAQQVVIPDIEEEVVRSGVIAVLDELDQRESEELLVEPDRSSVSLAYQRQVVDTADGAGWPCRP